MKKKNNHTIAKLLCDERKSSYSIPAVSILLSMIVASILLLILGKNPIDAYGALLKGCGILPKARYGGGKGMLADFFTFLNYLAPMIIASLAFVVASRAGLFNIGIAGQMLLAAYVCYVLIGYSEMNAWIAKPLVVVVSLIVGGLVGAFEGFLKYKFNIHEVVSTILISHTIRYLTGFSINGWYADQATRNSLPVSNASRLTFMQVEMFGQKCDIPLGIILALVFVFVINFIFNKTVFGFELKAVGKNNKCAKYTGINVGSRVVLSMAISGMLAGLAGVCYYMGYINNIVPKVLGSMGYDAIAVAVLGNSSPIGCIFASILVSIFQNGTSYMSSQIGVAKEIANLIIGILLLFAACGGFIKEKAKDVVDKAADEEKAAAKKESKKEA